MTVQWYYTAMDTFHEIINNTSINEICTFWTLKKELNGLNKFLVFAQIVIGAEEQFYI